MSVEPVTKLTRLIKPDESPRRSPAGPVPAQFAWVVLGRFGIVALVVGFFDIALAWYPFGAGNPAWEFGIINLTIWSLPFPTTGLVALLASGTALNSRRRVFTTAGLMLILAIVVIALIVLYVMVIPIALKGTPAGAELAVKKSLVKTVVLGSTFATFYLVLAVTALRRIRRQ
jgi:hypothetical protein